LLALACGSDDGGGDEPVSVPRETCADNPLLAGCTIDPAGNIVDPPVSAPPVVRDPNVPAPSTGDDVEALARAGAQNVLAANCGQCHGPQLAPAQASGGGMNYINDIDKLVENGKVIPLNSAGSLIIRRMTDGSMPPAQSGLPRVTQQDINTVAQFIDNPNFWQGYQAPGQDCTDQLIDFDQLYEDVAADLADLDADDALTTRYISLANRATAGVCVDDTSLDRDRQAMFKMVNALSNQTTIEQPRPVDADQTLYAIDITDYGWDQPVTVVIDGIATDFADKYEAIVAANLFAVEFEGDEADDAKADSGTTVPVMFADTMLDAAVIGNLYYALIDVDVNQTLDDFILNVLDIDVVANLEDEDQVRAGTTKSRISRQDRVLQRDEINVRQGVLWQSFDFADDQNESIFEDPFGFAEGGTEAIFTLPNGLFGFIIADENSLIVEDSDILLDTSQNNFRAVTMVSCSNCHAQGLISVEDEVREIAIANARTSELNRDEIEQLEAVYPSAAEFARVVEADSTSFYKNALTQAAVPLQGLDPIANVFLRFDQDLSLATAAGDLGVTPAVLEDELDLLDPVLAVLDGGVLDRDDFAAVYVNSLCELSIVNENQPLVQVCLDAEAALLQ
jgi:serine/threonine-protein kinase